MSIYMSSSITAVSRLLKLETFWGKLYSTKVQQGLLAVPIPRASLSSYATR